MILFVGRIREVREEDGRRSGEVSVRGARVEVSLDLVPEAQVGDSVLVNAGVALSVLRGEDEEERSPCA
jgi:hydrogenase expression/formation protein HypC